MESPCPWPENSSSDRTKAIEELVKGQDSALQLRRLLLLKSENINNDGDHGVVLNQDLVLKILTSFTNTLSILKNDDGGRGCGEYQSDEISQIQTNAAHLSWDGRKSEDSENSCNKTTSIIKDRRGCYKRRKCSDSWIKDSSNLVDDGHAWRKYGQKVILNAKFPRNYFRCTHKHDQGCSASKQVQRIEEDPPLFRTTYYGRHTCKNLVKASSQLFMDYTSRDHNYSAMISFCDNENKNPFLSSFPSIKQEYNNKNDQEIMMASDGGGGGGDDDDIMTHNDQSDLSDDYILQSPDDHQLTTYGSGIGVDSVLFES